MNIIKFPPPIQDKIGELKTHLLGAMLRQLDVLEQLNDLEESNGVPITSIKAFFEEHVINRGKNK